MTPPGTIAAFLSRINAPSYVTLGMLVIFRFFPTMTQEMRLLGQSMRNRGLLLPRQMAAHPAQTFEYALMPILMRIVQIADQLSVSAVARGVERGGKRESYYAEESRLLHWFIAFAFCVAALAVVLAGNGISNDWLIL